MVEDTGPGVGDGRRNHLDGHLLFGKSFRDYLSWTIARPASADRVQVVLQDARFFGPYSEHAYAVLNFPADYRLGHAPVAKRGCTTGACVHGRCLRGAK